MPRYILSFLFIFSFYFMFCFVLTSPPLMLCVYLQTFEAALFWKKKKTNKSWEVVYVIEKVRQLFSKQSQ